MAPLLKEQLSMLEVEPLLVVDMFLPETDKSLETLTTIPREDATVLTGMDILSVNSNGNVYGFCGSACGCGFCGGGCD